MNISPKNHLPTLAQKYPNINQLPISLRIVLESVARHEDGVKVTQQHVQELANWQPNDIRTTEIPFTVGRVVLQDFTGVPLLCDLAAMRSTALAMGQDVKKIEPLVPVDLVVDHSVQIDEFGHENALQENMKKEFERNEERYQLMKWGMQAFDTFKVVPPGIGIVHQVNLEYLARGILSNKKTGEIYFDSLVGTDSHTTMINGLGVVGWGVGGIEAEAAMLGQPVYFLTPDVVGFELTGVLAEGITATDMVLTITQRLREAKVVGKFVEFFGEGVKQLSLPDRATIANMAPEYGATMGFFPVDEITVNFLRQTGKTEQEVEQFKQYFEEQGIFGIPTKDQKHPIQYSQTISLDLSTIEPSVAGPKRPQDRLNLKQLKTVIDTEKSSEQLSDGDIVIAAITSCTNTSNPSVLLAAGLLAKKACEKGLTISKKIKTSFAPGSRVVQAYLEETHLQQYLNQLGFHIAAFGCTTCIGNAGDLTVEFNQQILENQLNVAAVLSGNRNFEARIHANIRSNFLMSPPLVVAFALAGTVKINIQNDPLGNDKNGNPVYLKDIWPTNQEISALLPSALNPETFKRLYQGFTDGHDLWNNISAPQGQNYNWPTSTYIAQPPFFDGFEMKPNPTYGIKNGKALALFGDSVTTDHISPAGSIKATSPAGMWLKEKGITSLNFNSYGARRGHHEVMMRGTFANVRIQNLMLPIDENGKRLEGGFTIYNHQKDVAQNVVSIYDAAMEYQQNNVPTFIFAGEEYGTGSSRDWAAKGTYLLGVKAVIAKSFERIHRSNLVGMGILPLQFKNGESIESLGLNGTETFSLSGIEQGIVPQQDVTLHIERSNGEKVTITVLLRVDTPIEVSYYEHGGILPYVLRELLA